MDGALERRTDENKMKIPKGIDSVYPIVMAEDYWANSYLSIARYYGQISVSGHVYVIVNKEGKDIFELSAEAEKAGREKAIEAGEPCDLCLLGMIPVYRHFGRDRFLELLKEGKKASELITMYNNCKK